MKLVISSVGLLITGMVVLAYAAYLAGVTLVAFGGMFHPSLVGWANVIGALVVAGVGVFASLYAVKRIFKKQIDARVLFISWLVVPCVIIERILSAAILSVSPTY